MKSLKNIIVAIVAILVIIVALQNTEAVETRMLFATISMPRALLLFVTLLVGFVAGVLASTKLPSFKKS